MIKKNKHKIKRERKMNNTEREKQDNNKHKERMSCLNYHHLQLQSQPGHANVVCMMIIFRKGLQDLSCLVILLHTFSQLCFFQVSTLGLVIFSS